MRIIPIDQLRPGMVVGRNIYDAVGRVLVAAGSVADAGFSKRLAARGINCLYVNSEGDELLTPDSLPEDLLHAQTRGEVTRVLGEIVKAAQVQGTYDTVKLDQAIRHAVEDVLTSPNRLVELIELRALGNESFDHAVRVTILCTMIGLDLGVGTSNLPKLALGALLHDIGQASLPDVPWNSAHQLTVDQRKQMQKHPRLGYDAIRRSKGLSLLAAHVAYQHHERLDGGGYPRGLKGDKIHLFGRIAAVAEVYDALTSQRPYRPAFWPHQAIEYLLAHSGSAFDPDAVRALVANVALYPVGALVELNTKERAEVLHTLRKYPTRPVIRIIHNGTRFLEKTVRVGLYEDRRRFIVRTLASARGLPEG